jgi:hypothetical protein
MLFVVNTAFMVYVFNELLLQNIAMLMPALASLSIMVGSIFHFISLILILIMINNLNKKFTVVRGTPIELPPLYANKLDKFKQIMIACFCVGSVILVGLLNNLYNKDSSTSMKIVICLMPIALIIMSSIQIATATEFSKLSRQELID